MLNGIHGLTLLYTLRKFIKLLDTILQGIHMVQVQEIHGGSAGTEYMYLILNNELVHVSQLPHARIVKVEERGRRRKLVVWDVPDNVVSGHDGIYVSFSSRGRYPYITYFKLPKDLKDLPIISISSLYVKRLFREDIRDPIKEIIMRRGIQVRLFDRERYQLSQYRRIVPKLVSDIHDDLRDMEMSMEHIIMWERAVRIIELLEDPTYAEYLSLILPTPQGRIKSLHEKIVHAYELWLLLKVIKSFQELGASLKSKELRIGFTENIPAITLNYEGKVIHVLYQPTIMPHIMSAFMNLEKPYHVVPDIAIVVLDEDKHIEYGNLFKYAEKVPILIEAKLSLEGRTKYESVDITIRQIRNYMKLLKNKPKVVVPIYERSPSAVRILNSIKGVRAIDEVNPYNQDKVKEFTDIIKSEATKHLKNI